ncbi:MAG: hypothetical protein M5U28_38365 [Sandaracinaceae bacterium]|nr:hypothetical protein [Sandaracinaceae bacterium]
MRPWMLFVLLLAACGSTADDDGAGPAETTGEESPPPDEQTAERPSLTAEECEQQGGTVVGDIGDGATHRPDYVCASGRPPIGNVALGVEGSVCCPE